MGQARPVDATVRPPRRRRQGHRSGAWSTGASTASLRRSGPEPRPSVELLVAQVALEVFGLLMLDQDLLVVELSIAVPDMKSII